MSDILSVLLQHAGSYVGEGINHEQESFQGHLTLTPIGQGFSLTFIATGLEGTIYHRESTLIAATFTGQIALWTLNSNVPGVLQHELRRDGPMDGSINTFS